MKQIKVHIHNIRTADVIHALKTGGFKNVYATEVKAVAKALDDQEQEYSIDIGEKVIIECKIELFCEAQNVSKAIEIIKGNAQIGLNTTGQIYVIDVEEAIPINEL